VDVPKLALYSTKSGFSSDGGGQLPNFFFVFKPLQRILILCSERTHDGYLKIGGMLCPTEKPSPTSKSPDVQASRLERKGHCVPAQPVAD
jgi:hypothetical protein